MLLKTTLPIKRLQTRNICSMSPLLIRESLRECPKQDFENDIRVTNHFQIAAWLVPHDDKAVYGGEDTYFISDFGNMFGVFDGVGGWINSGVNPRNYAFTLENNCSFVANSSKDMCLPPCKILSEGYNRTSRTKVVGSSTATVGTIRKENDSLIFDAYNVGDSGFMILKTIYHSELRQTTLEVALRSEEQQHEFNMPYQLGTGSSDTPQSGRRYITKLEYGDIIIVGTDGLWDNTYDRDILELLVPHDCYSAQEIAKKLAVASHEFAADRDRLSPFAKHAQDAWRDQSIYGGKKDDITVIVVKIQNQSNLM